MASYQVSSDRVKVDLVNDKRGRYTVLEIPSSDGKHVYRVDVTNRRCSCPAWKFARTGADGQRPMCKHLQGLGFSQLVAAPVKPVKVTKQMELDLKQQVLL